MKLIQIFVINLLILNRILQFCKLYYMFVIISIKFEISAVWNLSVYFYNVALVIKTLLNNLNILMLLIAVLNTNLQFIQSSHNILSSVHVCL